MRIDNLESENFILNGDANPEAVHKYKQIMKEKASMVKLVEEMTEFLADYGLTWRGNPSSSDEEENKGQFNYNQLDKELNFKKPQYRNKLPAEIDTEVLTRRIEELNFIAEKQRIVN